MRNDINEAIRRSREIQQKVSTTFPNGKRRKKVIKSWLEEKNWTEGEDSFHIAELSIFEKLAMSRLLVKQIVKYGYAWLPTTLKESGRRIATTAPILITLNLLMKAFLIPLFLISPMPESPYFAFALYSIIAIMVHENEVEILKKAPVVLNQYVSTLSLFFSPRKASLIFRGINYLIQVAPLLTPLVGFLIPDQKTDKLLAAYYYYLAFWYLAIQCLGARAVYMILDKNKENGEPLSWNGG